MQVNPDSAVPPHPATGPAPVAARLAVLTDFDGTLVEIAPTPDAVAVPSALPDLLAHAAAELDSAFALISGRTIADIDRFLSPRNFAVAGAHGTERRRADGSMETPDPAIGIAAEKIAEALEPLVTAHPALVLEAKDGAVALHYRQAPELEAACRQAMAAAIAGDELFTVLDGKMVLEARPLAVSKGTALRAFMQEEPFAGRTPIFIGDDTTDEDAFIAAQELGGVGIKVGEGPTEARMRVGSIESVHALIRGLGELAGGRRAATGS